MKKMIKKRKLEASEARSESRAHSTGVVPRDKSGLPEDSTKREKVRKIAKLGQRKLNQFGRAG